MTISTGLRDRLDAVTRHAVDSGDVPGAVVGVAAGDDVHVVCAGVGTLGGPELRADSLFRLSSITKPMTAAVVLTLVADGRLDLDAPVEKWLPELADRRVLVRPDADLDHTVPADHPPTLRELLAGTWGFGLQGAMFTAAEPWPVHTATLEAELHTLGPPSPAHIPDPDTWITRLGALPLMAQPGERWLYNTGMQVAGVLAARAAGAPLDDLFRERLLGPLGMGNSAFWTDDAARLVTAYQREGGELVVADPPEGEWSRRPAFADGGAGLVSSVADVLRFGAMLRHGGEDVLPAHLVAQMTHNQLTAGQRERVWPGFDLLDAEGWGLGVAVHADGHYRWDGGYGTSWSNVPDRDLTVVVLTQRLWDETGPPAIRTEAVAVARDPA